MGGLDSWPNWMLKQAVDGKGTNSEAAARIIADRLAKAQAALSNPPENKSDLVFENGIRARGKVKQGSTG